MPKKGPIVIKIRGINWWYKAVEVTGCECVGCDNIIYLNQYSIEVRSYNRPLGLLGNFCGTCIDIIKHHHKNLKEVK